MIRAFLAALDRGRPWAMAALVAAIVVPFGIGGVLSLTQSFPRHQPNDRRMLHIVSAAIVQYGADNRGVCPPTLQALVDGKYLTRMPRDRFGRLPRFTCPGKHEDAIEVVAAGHDGQFGTGDDVGIAQ